MCLKVNRKTAFHSDSVPLPCVGLWRVSPITDVDDNDDEGDDEDGDVQLRAPVCVCETCPSLHLSVSVHEFKCTHAHYHTAEGVMTYMRSTLPPPHSCPPPPPFPFCVNENARLYLERADVTSGLSGEPITVGVGLCYSETNPGLLH